MSTDARRVVATGARLAGWGRKALGALDRVRHISDIRIQTKLLMAFGIPSLLMLALSALIFLSYMHEKEANTRDVIRQMNVQAMEKIDAIISEMSDLSLFVLLRDENSQYGRLFSLLDQSNRTGHLDLDFFRTLEGDSFRLLYFRPDVHSIFLFNRAGRGGYAVWNASLLVKDYNPVSESWFARALAAQGSRIIISRQTLGRYGSVAGTTYFSVARGIVKIEDKTSIGVVLINGNPSALTEIMNPMMIVARQRIMLLDGDNSVILDSGGADPGGVPDRRLVSALTQNEASTDVVALGGSRFLLSHVTSSETDWTLVNLIPLRELNRNLYALALTTAFITAGILALSIGFAFLISRQFARPLTTLVGAIRRVERGDFDVQTKEQRRDEIGTLARSFDRMTRRVRTLIQEVYIDKLAQKELDLQLLKSQVNPHFLYNALESIRMVAETNGEEEISKMAFSLGRLLRYGISEEEHVWVEEEVAHLQQYIELQRHGFEDSYTVEVDIEPALYRRQMIRLVLQPLVENAIQHGVSGRATGGLIRVHGFCDKEAIAFEVTDNGKGMKPAAVRAINEYIHGRGPTAKGIGLRNVHRRIQICYGTGYGVEVRSRWRVGTTVVARIGTLTPAHIIRGARRAALPSASA